MGLSEVVAAAVEGACNMIRQLVTEFLDGKRKMYNSSQAT
jgi:hypothetical protein